MDKEQYEILFNNERMYVVTEHTERNAFMNELRDELTNKGD